MSGTSWLLGGGYSWHSGDPTADRPGSAATTVVASEDDGLSLGTLPDGALGLASKDETLGRLTLPRGVAIDGETVLILTADGKRVLRYDAVRSTLVPLAQIGAEGLPDEPADAAFAEPRRFRDASNIAAAGGVLYVADPAAHRVQVFDLATLALIRIHDGIEDPADVAAGPHGVDILDRASGRVLRGSPSNEQLAVAIDVPAKRGRWNRMAIDREDRVYLLDRTGPRPALDVFVLTPPMPATTAAERIANSAAVRSRFGASEVYVDGRGGIVLPESLLDPCGLRKKPEPHMRRWYVDGRWYVIDARARVLRVHLADGRLRHRFGPLDANGIGVAPDAPDVWSPVDLVSVSGCVLVLDERHQTVYAHKPGAELHKRFSAPADFERTWRRLADDGSGCLLLWDGAGDTVDRVDQRGRMLGQVPAREVRQRFVKPAPPPIDAHQPPRLTRNGAIPRSPKEPPQWPEPAFERRGVWTSQWLDSDLYNCQWHVMELAVGALPPGSRVVVRTRTSNEPQSAAEVLATLGGVGALGSWRQTPALEGPPQPDEMESKPRDIDVLVPSRPGQYIQLQIELTSDGMKSPVINSLRLRFPRESLLQYLPAIYSKPEEQRDFLDRFLAIAQTTWSAIEREADTFERFLDPDSVPAEAMAYLAGWLDLQLEGSWTPEQNRRLLQVMPDLRAKWGTPAGLQAWLRVYLANLGGVTGDQLEAAGIPGIVESFVDRRKLMLNRPGAASLCSADGLWSPSVERRFQVGVFDREGEVELVSAGDPQVDMFRHYAHSFRVYVPAPWVRTPDDEALIRRAIDLQKPAHTTYELVLVEARFRIGEQSTIELDTVIGAPLPGPLLCPAVDDAPGRPPYQRLGFDTTLGCGSDHDHEDRLERRLV